MKTFSELLSKNVARDWSRVRTLIGRDIDEVAGKDCGQFHLETRKRNEVSTETLHDGESDQFTNQAWVLDPDDINDDGSDWVPDFYVVALHEIGHLAWNDRNGPTIQDLTDISAMYSRVPEPVLEMVVGLDSKSALTKFEAFCYMRHVIFEAQAQCFALCVLDRLMADGFPVREWVAHAIDILLFCDDPGRYAFVPAYLLDRKMNFADVAADLRKPERQIAEIFLSLKATKRRDSHQAALERFLTTAEKRWGITIDESGCPCYDDDLWERQIGFRAKSLIAPASASDLAPIFDAIKTDPLLLGMIQRDVQLVRRGINRIRNDSEGRAELLLACASQVALSPQERKFARELLQEIVSRYPKSDVRFRVQHFLATFP